MIPRECKRLAEVDFPIAAVSQHAAREKSIRHGHPSTLHLWWARRPLASSRAVLLALLLPDPCDAHCPEGFKRQAREILRQVRQPPASDVELRQGLLAFIANFADWKNAADRTHLSVSRALVRAAHGEEPPLVVDPFAGGGSIPLEALRLGCEAFASDLNPVACLILKVMLEDIPRHGAGLAEELRRVGGEIKRQAERELADLYPKDADGAAPIAYLWARTVRCEAPNCGAEIPLMRSFWLCKKARRKRALRPRVERGAGAVPSVELEVFEPQADGEVRGGTVARARATCLCCGAVLRPERVRAQLAAERGGADAIFDDTGKRIGGARMTAVVTLRPEEKGRHYRLPTDADYAAVRKAQERVARVLAEWERGGKEGICPVPDEPLPPIGTLGFRVQRYGMMRWGDLFTARQKVALVEMARLASDLQETLKGLIAVSVDRTADYASSLCSWHLTGEKINHTFGRQALPMIWDFAEVNPWSNSSGNWSGAVEWGAKTAEVTERGNVGQVQPADATDHPLPDQSASVWFTDPPYYDAIPYSDLSDFFLVWLKRVLPDNPLLRDPFDPDNPLSPKTAEAVQDETKQADGRPKDRAWFEETMAKAFAEGRRILSEDGVGSVVFAHKTTEGWEALLAGMIRGGWTITGSWPLATEMASRLRARDSAALATSIHLICRPRPYDAPIGDWADVLRELPLRVADWIQRLQAEGIRGADLVFACIGPALEIFSRYPAVETAEGHTITLSAYLEKVWEVVGRAALQQVLGAAEARARNGDLGALEEDARLTALFLWTLQSTVASSQTYKQDDDEDDEDDDEKSASATVVSPAPVDESASAATRGLTPVDVVPSGGSLGEMTATVTVSIGTGRPGFSLPYDVVRRFAQPMGIDLDTWTDRIISIKKGIVSLLPVSERVKDLFGADGAAAAARAIENDPQANVQQTLFPAEQHPQEPPPQYSETSADELAEPSDAHTTLDRVHIAMLLQANGHANALRTLITAEQDRGSSFLRLANALSALYPQGCHEKRLLDAMLLAVPR